MKRLNKILGENIRKNRKEFHMNQEELGRAVKLSRVSIVNIEAGRQQPPVDKLMEFCALFSCTPNDLLPEVGPSKPMKSVMHVKFTTKAAAKRFYADPDSVKLLNKMVTKAHYMNPKKIKTKK